MELPTQMRHDMQDYTNATRHARLLQRALIPACSNIQNLYPAPGKKHNGQGMAQHVLGHALSLRGCRQDESNFENM